MSAVNTYMVWAAVVGVALIAVIASWCGILRARKHADSDDSDVAWFGYLGQGTGEDTSIERRIAAGDASRRRIARVGQRRLP